MRVAAARRLAQESSRLPRTCRWRRAALRALEDGPALAALAPELWLLPRRLDWKVMERAMAATALVRAWVLCHLRRRR